MSGESKEDYDKRIERARNRFDKQFERQKMHMAQVQAFSVDAMKAPALVAAAGVAAALGYFSANYGRLAGTDAVAAFNDILWWLFLSLLLTVIAPSLAYFSQGLYIKSIDAEEQLYDHPFVKETPMSRRYKRLGDAARWLCIVAVAASIGCLAFGGLTFLSIVR